MLLWANDTSISWGGVSSGTFWMTFTCCPSVIFLASLWLEMIKIFKLVILLTLRSSKLTVILITLGKSNWPILFIFTNFGQVTVFLQTLGKTLCGKNNSNLLHLTKISRTKDRTWLKSFSVIQSVWNQELVSCKKLPPVTRFSDLHDKNNDTKSFT